MEINGDILEWRKQIVLKTNCNTLDFHKATSLSTISKEITSTVKKSFIQAENSKGNKLIPQLYKDADVCIPIKKTKHETDSNSEIQPIITDTRIPNDSQLHDLLARLLRDETHPNTRFTSLSEIPNFEYRLKWANVSITETFQYLIEIIQNVDNQTENGSISYSNFSHANVNSSSSSSCPNLDNSKRVFVTENENSLANGQSTIILETDRPSLTTEVLAFSGIKPFSSRSSIFKAYHRVKAFLAPLPKNKLILLGSALGITTLLSQPILLQNIRSKSGVIYTLKEPKFRSISGCSGSSLAGLDDAIASLLIIPHPCNILLCEKKYYLENRNSINHIESVLVVSRIIEALGQHIVDTISFTAPTVLNHLKPGKNHSLLLWEHRYPAGNITPDINTLEAWIHPARRLLLFIISNEYVQGNYRSKRMTIEKEFLLNNQSQNDYDCTIIDNDGLQIHEDLMRLIHPQTIFQLLSLRKISYDNSLNSILTNENN